MQGAAEWVLRRCKYYMNGAQIQEITPEVSSRRRRAGPASAPLQGSQLDSAPLDLPRQQQPDMLRQGA